MKKCEKRNEIPAIFPQKIAFFFVALYVSIQKNMLVHDVESSAGPTCAKRVLEYTGTTEDPTAVADLYGLVTICPFFTFFDHKF